MTRTLNMAFCRAPGNLATKPVSTRPPTDVGQGVTAVEIA